MTFRNKAAVAAAAAGLATVSFGLASPAFAALPAPDGYSQLIPMGGSDTTYEMMQDLSTLYNKQDGCNTAVTQPLSTPILFNGFTSPIDGRCIRIDGNDWTSGDYSGNMLLGNPDHDVATQYFPIGSGNGINQLDTAVAMGGARPMPTIIAARSSSGWSTAGTRQNKQWIAYAREALTWTATKTGLATRTNFNLTTDQIKNIYLGCDSSAGNLAAGAVYPNNNVVTQKADNSWITKWATGMPGGGTPGNTADDIDIFTAQAGSGTRGTWDSFIGGSSEKCIPGSERSTRIIFENNPRNGILFGFNTGVARSGKDQKRAIYFYSAGRFAENKDTKFSLGSINGIAPTIANVTPGAATPFPSVRFVYNLYAAAETRGEVLNFTGVEEGASSKTQVGWLCRSAVDAGTNPYTGTNNADDIKAVISAHGFAPIPEGTLSRSATISGSPAGFSYVGPCIIGKRNAAGS